MPRPATLPDWDHIPPVEGMPAGTAWNLWGKGDMLGALNLLTPENTVEAAKEIKSGLRVQLDLPMDVPKWPSFGRQQFAHQITFKPWSSQDIVHYNTQGSSQWDGFRHIAHPPTLKFYQDLDMAPYKEGKEPSRNGIQYWVEAGGIAGRGILLDWARWWEHTHPGETLPNPCKSYGIPVSELAETAKHQGTEIKVGDILIVRCGFLKWYNGAKDEDRKFLVAENDFQFIGVAPGQESKEWIWNNHFAAVAGDAVGFEMSPVARDHNSLHQWLIPLAGIPIGELFNTEQLAQVCEKEKRWSFFFTSAPINVTGGVASSPNAIAIF
ncbi:hypothetical protein CALVIDRAFT_533322 [Calocera viscosa TUFC12733]|uniref:Cyclase n=1 Tax=Calocera viscosa (strain TUFC12733) TaxID=1330018 RepID=A0A167RKN2_CALVF|nr:hypothetical protein CALVIDRAFT_533322 [Calocera viscosa TUFC12733]